MNGGGEYPGNSDQQHSRIVETIKHFHCRTLLDAKRQKTALQWPLTRLTQSRIMTLNKDKLENFKEQLIFRREELAKEVTKATAEMIEEEPFHADAMDQAAADSDRSVEVSIKNRERNLIREIDDALRRIESGLFGECESCGEDIGDARMKANPSTTLCIDCKSELESEQNRFPRQA